jgi:phage gpG-like protein
LQPVAREVAGVVNRSTEQRFRSKGAGTWPPLSDATLARKTGDHMLVDTGALRESVTHQTGRQTAEDEVTVSAPAPPYARLVDSGTVNMPARKLTDLTPAERRQIAGLVGDRIMGRR